MNEEHLNKLVSYRPNKANEFIMRSFCHIFLKSDQHGLYHAK